ncbi:MAG: hypothetical protein KC416_06650 [Myxococcales bacterium]|nr:hypothetical protein [Myxococcales bacterium]
MKHGTLFFLMAVAIAGACGETGGDPMTTTKMGGNVDEDAGGGASNLNGNGSCPPIGDRMEFEVEGDIDEDTSWSCDTLPILTGRLFVTDGATLTLESGTVVFGDEGSAVIVTKGARLLSLGESDNPVVLTSSSPLRQRGDWGGVVLLGDAPINVPGGTNHIEGIEINDDRGLYGGQDSKGNCGELTYTRIEYAGDEFSIDNELNGLTLGGCGSDTKLSYIQIHRGLDDGIEFFGGTASVDHLVVTGAMDDSIDWDEGWTGTASFIIVQQHPGAGENAIEADNLEDPNTASPRSNPEIRNATLIGPNEAAGNHRGILFRRGTWGMVKNAIFMGFGKEAIDVRDAETVKGATQDPIALSVEGSLFFEIGGPGKEAWFDKEPMDGSEEDDDGAFDEAAFFSNGARKNLFGTDPMIADAYDITEPDFVPAADAPGGMGAVSGADFKGATYVGAIQPGGEDWTAGWTAFPVE